MIVLPNANTTGEKRDSNTNIMDGWGAHQSVVPRSIPIALHMMTGGNETGVQTSRPHRHLQSCEPNLPSHVHKLAPDLNVQSQSYVVETKFAEDSG